MLRRSDEHTLRFRGNAILFLQLLRDGLSELPDPGSGCVFREICVEGLLGGVDDVGRRREVRLPDRKGEDLLAARLHLRDHVSDMDRRRGLNRADTLREMDHAGEEYSRLESFTARPHFAPPSEAGNWLMHEVVLSAPRGSTPLGKNGRRMDGAGR